MDITRRNFLKVVGTSALGTVLFNACRWPETELQVQSPVDIPEDMVKGVDTYYATQCVQCLGGCGVTVRVMEGRAKKIEGNPDFPINRGKHSARCEAGLQDLYHPDRIRTPLMRVGERGSGQFRAISWDEAHAELTGRLSDLRGGAGDVVLVTQPLRGHLGLVVARFADAYGARHIPFEPLEQTVLRQAIKRVFNQDRLPDLDIENAQFILSFGADFLGTWVSPVRFARGYGHFRQGEGRSRGTLVQVDSHFSMTTANADEWVPVNPGTEGMLALSMAHVIISDNPRNPAANSLTGGRGAEALDAFKPSIVAGITGVNEGKIRELAHAFVSQRPSLAIGGDSAAGHTNGLFNLTAIYALNYLVDAVNNKGGIIFNPAPPLDLADSSSEATCQQWQDLAPRMRDGNVKAMVVRGANPIYGLPAALNITEAMRGIQFVAAFTTVLDETAAQADLILPEHTYLETWGDSIPDPGPGYQTIGFQQPVVRPLYHSRGFGDELLQVGRDLGLNLPWESVKEAMEQGAEKLQSQDNGSVRAATVEGFWNGVLQRGGWWNTKLRADKETTTPPLLATQTQAPYFEGVEEEYPFTLTVFRSLALAEGQNAHLPWLQATPDPITTVVWQTWVEVNTTTATELGLREGDIVAVESPAGSIEIPVYPHPAVPPTAVAIPTGQGHTFYGRYAENRGANVLSILAPTTERETGALAWGATRVRLRKTGNFRKASKFEGAVPPFPLGEEGIIQVTSPDQ